MMINAKEKIMNIINELLPMDNSIELDQYRNKTAVLLFSKLSYYKNINELLKKYDHENLQYAIDIYTYPNGLIRLESYCILNGEYVISQTVITESLYDESERARRLYGESKLLAAKKLSDHVTPNSFVNNVNCEVNAIIKKIEAIINEYNINDNFVKSLQKK